MKSAVSVSMLVAALLLPAARPASACSSDYPYMGLTLEIFDDYPVTEGGALLVRASTYFLDVDGAMDDLTLWEVRKDEVVQTGEFAIIPLFDAAATSIAPEQHVFALIWRPDTPFVAGGVYTLDLRIAHPYDSMPRRVTLEVLAAPPLEPPAMTTMATTALVDPTERVCCETYEDSCGGTYLCEVTRATVLPAIEVRIGYRDDFEPHRLVWVAPVSPGGEIGPRAQGAYARVVGPAFWQGQVVFDAPADEYCVVAGATSMVDGSERVSEPQCFDQATLGVPHEGAIEPSSSLTPFIEGPGGGDCLGPVVYEADGAPYPREAEQPEASGCSVTDRGPWSLLLLAFTRRRRARA